MPKTYGCTIHKHLMWEIRNIIPVVLKQCYSTTSAHWNFMLRKRLFFFGGGGERKNWLTLLKVTLCVSQVTLSRPWNRNIIIKIIIIINIIIVIIIIITNVIRQLQYGYKRLISSTYLLLSWTSSSKYFITKKLLHDIQYLNNKS